MKGSKQFEENGSNIFVKRLGMKGSKQFEENGSKILLKDLA